MFKKLRTVIYHVADLEAAKAWYVQATGMQPYFDEPFYVGFNINGSELGLDPDLTGITQSGNHTTSYWEVENVAVAVEKLKFIGATLVQPRTNVGGTIFTAIVEDPFGNQIGLIEGA